MTIVINDRKFLEKPSEDVASYEEALPIIEELKRELANSKNGIGLAAPQIGIFKKVFVIKRGDEILSFVNPQIMECHNPFVFRQEGCLSFPDIRIDTIRDRMIALEDLEHGKTILEDIEAICADHEFDHLIGKTMFDRMIPKDIYALCPCDSGQKFKFCCRKYLPL